MNPERKRRLEVGDVLIVQVATENREWGYNPAPDGTRVIVTGFETGYRGRVYEFGHKPGRYRFNDQPTLVREDNGETVTTGSFHLRHEDGSNIPMDLDGEWVDDLPSLPFWEGDLVATTRNTFGTDPVFITRISYRDIETLCNDGVTPYPIYTIAPTMSAGISTSARESDLSLVSRGNVWKYYHGEPLVFDSVSEEAQFYDGQLGRTEDVRNEICGYFSWTIEEAVNAVREGKGDAISVTPGLFGSKSRPRVKKFLDTEVGAKVRAETLAGWSNFNPTEFEEEITEVLNRRKELDTLRTREASHCPGGLGV